MVAFKVQRRAIEASSDLKPVVYKAQDERVELVTCWSKRNKVASREEVEDVQEYLRSTWSAW